MYTPLHMSYSLRARLDWCYKVCVCFCYSGCICSCVVRWLVIALLPDYALCCDAFDYVCVCICACVLRFE